MKISRSACIVCIMEKNSNLKCPADSEDRCILSLDKIYIDVNFFQVFKL